jgi:hypothetical protein
MLTLLPLIVVDTHRRARPPVLADRNSAMDGIVDEQA